jgi:small-conductance mechanosensitive channel
LPALPEIPNDLAARLLLAFVLVVVVFLLVRLGLRLAPRYVSEPARLYAVSKTIRRAGGLLAVVLLAAALVPQGNVVTLLTVIGAGLTIALRELPLSIAGWMRITFMNTYRQSDRIEVGGVHGDVIDIRLLRTTLMETRGWVDADQSTGRIVHIPNSWVFEHAVYNYSRGFSFIWNELRLAVTFRSDWEAARDIIQELAEQSASIVEQQAAKEIREMSREYLIHYSILTPFVYVGIETNGVGLTLRYLCEVRKRRGTEHALTMSILKAFKEHGGIELAYPMVGVSTPETDQFGPVPRPPARGGKR